MRNAAMRNAALGAAAVLAAFGSAPVAADTAPYAGLEARDIKALADDEIAGLLEGQGMMLALAAELNGHPGPMHVLELAEQLALDAGQAARTQEIFDAMRAEAKSLGTDVLALERELDAAFRKANPQRARIEELTAAIGAKRAALRAVHLTAHLDMNAVLTPEQRERYAHLRGYRGNGHEHGAPGHGGHRGHGGRPH